jgi:excisionase family DNA binding protein
MKKGLHKQEDDEERQRGREAHAEEARLRDEIMRLSSECKFQRMARLCEWLTQAEAARMVGVNPGTISRAVRRGEIETAGVRGRWLRISPTSLRDYWRKRAPRARAEHARWADAID